MATKKLTEQETAMDMNELLSSMAETPEHASAAEPEELPSGSEDADLEFQEEMRDSLPVEAASEETETPTSRPKRLGRKKRTDAETAGTETETEKTTVEAPNDEGIEPDALILETDDRTAETSSTLDGEKPEIPAIASPEAEILPDSAEEIPSGEATLMSDEAIPEQEETASRKVDAPALASAVRRQTRPRRTEAPVLTIESRSEVETEESREDAIWHEIHNAYRTRKILTGQLGGVEQTDTGKTIAIADYKGFRIVIPLKEMMINIGRSPSGQEYAELMLRQNKILGNMLGAEIDFIVRGIDSKSRSVVASRREAMLKKRQIFYFDTDQAGMYRIYDGRIVQARVIAVAEKVVRVEVFGVECSIMARDLAWDWIGDAHDRFSVGDQLLVRVLNVRRDSLEDMGIRADVKSVSQNTSHDNLKRCRVQSKYAGKVTDVHKGVVYIRLSNGVNAVAHSCYDYRTPGKKDDVSFAVTRLDEERGVAVGIITRIIRQNL